MSNVNRSPPATPPAVLISTASSSAAGCPGQRTRSEPASRTCARRVLPATCLTENDRLPTARLAAKIASRSVPSPACGGGLGRGPACDIIEETPTRRFAPTSPFQGEVFSLSDRHRTLQRRLVELGARARINHLPAIHHEEIVAQFLREIEILLHE